MEWKQTSYDAWYQEDDLEPEGWFYQITGDVPSGPFTTEQAAMQHLDDTIEDRRKA